MKSFEKQQAVLAQANTFLGKNNAKTALDLLKKVIQELELVKKDLTQEQSILLGHAYLLRARAHAKLKQYSRGDSDLTRAYSLVNVDENSLAELLIGFIDGRYTGTVLFSHCIRFLYMRQRKPPDAVHQKVLSYLYTCLTLQPGLSEKDYRDLISKAREVIQVEPNLWWAYSSLGKAAFLVNDIQTAFTNLETAVRIFPNDRDSWTYLGMTYLRINRPQDARRAYEYSLTLDENQPDLAHELGIMILDDPRYQAKAAATAALRWLQLAAKLLPNNAIYQLDLARAALMGDDPYLAKKSAQKALSLDPKLLPAHLIIGNILYDEESWEEALHHYEALEGSHQASDTTHLRLGHCYAEVKRWDEAIHLLEPLKDRENLTYYPLGRAYLGKHEFSKAVETLRRSIAGNADDLSAWYALGCALAWQSQSAEDAMLSEAQQCFERMAHSQHHL